MSLVVLVSGIAQHSVGEALVENSARWPSPAKIICADIERNSWLERRVDYFPIQLNLNPLQHAGGYSLFSGELERKLTSALAALGEGSINCVVQSAGAYWSGQLVAAHYEERERLYGVNLFGHVELLHTVMRINRARGVRNEDSLTHIDVGSFQGLHARPGRSLYASSKAAGIDFAAALNAGHELARLIYFAPGPIDTPMLHYNHWVVKAGGSEELFRYLKNADRDHYRAIFVDCCLESLTKALSEQTNSLAEILEQFSIYKAQREEAQASELGVLRCEECAAAVSGYILDVNRFPSGVYLLKREKAVATTYYARFEELDRLRILQGAHKSNAPGP